MTIPFSDAELFDNLDLDFDGLRAVKAAVASGDPEGAMTAFVAYLRSRGTRNWFSDDDADLPEDEDLTRMLASADAIVRGEVNEQAIPHAFPRGEIDWFYNPTRESDDLAVNNEWQWQLNRMGFWQVLSRAYLATGDEIYARTFARHLRSWAEQCPRPEDHGNYAQSCWRTIESGIRMRESWPAAFHAFLHARAFSDREVALYVKLCIEHGRHLRAHHRPHGNWLTMEMAGLYTIGAVFPELKPAADWRRYAIDASYRELDAQFTPDGAQVELSPGYHWVALGNILAIPKLAKAVGRADELPGDFLTRAEKGFTYTLLLRTPDGSTPRANDTPNEQDVAAIMRVAVDLFPERRDFLWVATNGAEGDAPERTSAAFPYAGYYAMRSGWGADATMACFDAGPAGLAHIHQDKLNLTVWAYGREVLLDTGGGPYEQSKWRRYGVDTFSHNTVLVDGLPQRRERGFSTDPLADAVWESTADCDFAAGIYDAAYGEGHPATHVRRMLFVKPDLFLVWDVLTPKDGKAHSYQARWHVKTPHTAQNGAIVTTADEGVPNLAIVPLRAEGLTVRTVSAQEEPELLGWWIRKRVQPSAVPAATVLHDREGAGVQHFLTLLLPLKAGETNPVKKVTVTGETSADVDLADGRTLHCTGAGEGLHVTETLRDGAMGRDVRSRQR